MHFEELDGQGSFAAETVRIRQRPSAGRPAPNSWHDWISGLVQTMWTIRTVAPRPALGLESAPIALRHGLGGDLGLRVSNMLKKAPKFWPRREAHSSICVQEGHRNVQSAWDVHHKKRGQWVRLSPVSERFDKEGESGRGLPPARVVEVVPRKWGTPVTENAHETLLSYVLVHHVFGQISDAKTQQRRRYNGGRAVANDLATDPDV
jgi:hypothetical protein